MTTRMALTPILWQMTAAYLYRFRHWRTLWRICRALTARGHFWQLTSLMCRRGPL